MGEEKKRKKKLLHLHGNSGGARALARNNVSVKLGSLFLFLSLCTLGEIRRDARSIVFQGPGTSRREKNFISGPCNVEISRATPSEFSRP